MQETKENEGSYHESVDEQAFIDVAYKLLNDIKLVDIGSHSELFD